MLLGILLALIAGTLLSMQNIFNTMVNLKVGKWATTTLVLGLGFLSSLTFGLLFQGKQLFNINHMETWYWFSGLIGVGVVICLVQGIKLLGPTISISITLLAQLGIALVFDSFGLMGLEKVPFTMNQLIGVLILGGGILVFKLGGGSEAQEKSTS